MRAMLLVVLSVLCATGWAQAYPSRPITLVVPFAAGGPTDTIARTIAQAMSRNLKQTVIVENISGAGGTVGTAQVARSQPDGYTLLLYHVGMATAPVLYRTLPFDPMRDFDFIGEVTDVPMTLVARPDFPAKN